MVLLARAVMPAAAQQRLFVMFGGVVNPLTFVPMAFSTTVETTKAFQWVSFVSFVSLSVGLIAAAAYFIFG
ncbi:hypothetical protein [Pseudomonas protegens]|uniref:hypothetical protein n=1 Tax=Pseudomonas protegens TaxID=380021 RepID=UPI001F481EDE|nr:hypothetical protein [Pseudomonas protegens]